MNEELINRIVDCLLEHEIPIELSKCSLSKEGLVPNTYKAVLVFPLDEDTEFKINFIFDANTKQKRLCERIKKEVVRLYNDIYTKHYNQGAKSLFRTKH